MVPADSGRISRVPPYSGNGLAARIAFRIRGSHPLRRAFPGASAMPPGRFGGRPYNPAAAWYRRGLGSSAFARHYLRNHFCFLFLRVMRCFSSPGWPLRTGAGGTVARAGLPHSEIRGSGDICSSPRLIAACHVLLRLRQPRHPSCALVSFPWFFLYYRGSAGCHVRHDIGANLLLLLLVFYFARHDTKCITPLPVCQCAPCRVCDSVWRITDSNR